MQGSRDGEQRHKSNHPTDPTNELTDPTHPYHLYGALLSFLFNLIGTVVWMLVALVVYFAIRNPHFGIGICAAIALIWFFCNLFRDH